MNASYRSSWKSAAISWDAEKLETVRRENFQRLILWISIPYETKKCQQMKKLKKWTEKDMKNKNYCAHTCFHHELAVDGEEKEAKGRKYNNNMNVLRSNVESVSNVLPCFLLHSSHCSSNWVEKWNVPTFKQPAYDDYVFKSCSLTKITLWNMRHFAFVFFLCWPVLRPYFVAFSSNESCLSYVHAMCIFVVP